MIEDGRSHRYGDDRQTYVPISTIFSDTTDEGCRVCGNPVTDPFKLYCSRYCKNLAEAIHSLLTWESVRTFVRDHRDDRTCQRCERKSGEDLPDNVFLEVDHIKPISKGGHPFDPRNLQTLCEPCHDIKGTSIEDFRDKDPKEAPKKQEFAKTVLSDFTDAEPEPDGPSLLELGKQSERDDTPSALELGREQSENNDGVDRSE
ncbi:HNH endonuclease [Halosimplex pelagicum]|jgi:5-methylcytosine-specific restriction endonuclease McrA|uniref:HNH endonuclease n=1 Tax=Halosimplex pelagicum TaxID=869886 RepID=A0A7D5TT46_9EURY|nr:HNH endonuclease [Halosimplex pelagicum]QLH82372.1 HNH endonuclease [Halosimplex pelagicum]